MLHLPTSWWPARSRSLPHMHVQRWDLAQIPTCNCMNRRRTRYHCASDPAGLLASYKLKYIVKSQFYHSEQALHILLHSSRFRNLEKERVEKLWLTIASTPPPPGSSLVNNKLSLLQILGTTIANNYGTEEVISARNKKIILFQSCNFITNITAILFCIFSSHSDFYESTFRMSDSYFSLSTTRIYGPIISIENNPPLNVTLMLWKTWFQINAFKIESNDTDFEENIDTIVSYTKGTTFPGTVSETPYASGEAFKSLNVFKTKTVDNWWSSFNFQM